MLRVDRSEIGADGGDRSKSCIRNRPALDDVWGIGHTIAPCSDLAPIYLDRDRSKETLVEWALLLLLLSLLSILVFREGFAQIPSCDGNFVYIANWADQIGEIGACPTPLSQEGDRPVQLAHTLGRSPPPQWTARRCSGFFTLCSLMLTLLRCLSCPHSLAIASSSVSSPSLASIGNPRTRSTDARNS